MSYELKTPVVFFTFNRLDTAKLVFERIREAKPYKLYLISDAPRDDRAGEKEKVEEVRIYIENSVDWECEVIKNYADKNLGCGIRISSGLNWVFEREEKAIILEDDCLPDLTFFEYCDQMLEYYKDSNEIMLIGGNNPIASCYEISGDYTFTTIPFIWGWATWARAWKYYDFDIKNWPKQKRNPIWKKVFTRNAYWLYMSEFDELYHHRFNIWSYQILFMIVLENMLCIVPKESHVLNIGFQEESTTTKNLPKWMVQDVKPVRFPINHPDVIERDIQFDTKYMGCFCKNGPIVHIKKILGLNINKSIMKK